MLSAAACIAGCDPKKIAMLPEVEGFPREIIVQRVQITPYYQALTAAGAKLVIIGGDDGATEAEFEQAMGPETVAIAYGPDHSQELMEHRPGFGRDSRLLLTVEACR